MRRRRRVISSILTAGPASSVGCAAAWYAHSHGFDDSVRQHSFVETDHEIISTAILPLPLIQLLTCIGESPSICPFLKNNGHEALKGPSAIIFQEWTDTRTFSYLKYTLIYNSV